jgi:hypothetical protein
MSHPLGHRQPALHSVGYERVVQLVALGRGDELVVASYDDERRWVTRFDVVDWGDVWRVRWVLLVQPAVGCLGGKRLEGGVREVR